MALLIYCPSCNRKLKAPETVLGKTIRCPGCDTRFVAQVAKGEEEEAPVVLPVATGVKTRATRSAAPLEEPEETEDSPPRRKRPRYTEDEEAPKASRRRRDFEDDEEEEEERPRTRRFRKKSSSSSLAVLVLLAVVGGLILLSTVGTAVVRNLLALRTIPAADWQEFHFPDGSATVIIPGTPSLSNQALHGGPGQKYTLERKRENAVFVVAYMDLPRGRMNPNALTIAANAERDGMVKTLQASVVSEQDVTLNNYPGREIQLKPSSGKGIMIERLYLVPHGTGHRCYLIAVGGDSM
ncbi:MAG: hypothetical protein JO112_06765, partial [Planctomycetes bacterium]|nr:hypothetical protein [Planctomycetota bacterium]